MTRKHYIVAFAAAGVLLTGGYFAFDAVKFNKKTNEDKKQNNVETNQEEIDKQPVQALVKYEITDVNKKDGDIFSVPDNITYKVTPSAATSRVKMVGPNDAILFSGESKADNPSFQVYPSGRYREGTPAEIVIEILDGVEIKATKKIQVSL